MTLPAAQKKELARRLKRLQRTGTLGSSWDDVKKRLAKTTSAKRAAKRKSGDPLIDEIRAIKESISARFGHDVAKLCAQLQRDQKRYLKARANRGSRAKYDRVLKKVRSIEPMPEDRAA